MTHAHLIEAAHAANDATCIQLYDVQAAILSQKIDLGHALFARALMTQTIALHTDTWSDAVKQWDIALDAIIAAS